MLAFLPNRPHADLAMYSSLRTFYNYVPIIQTFSNNNQPISAPIDNVDGDRTSSHGKKSCRPCFYTGLATCAGFAGYFFYLASEPQNLKHKKFLLAGSAAWTLAGVYRYYLD